MTAQADRPDLRSPLPASTSRATKNRLGGAAAVLALSLLLPACALVLGRPRIAELRNDPARYYDRTVTVEGVVTTSWGAPLLPLRVYQISDGTGELTVIAQDGRVPTRGTRVRVRGRVGEIATLGGRAIGLHLRQQSLSIRRH
jgi:hypothetical protein